jgi:addiction module HigA family antidote
MMNKLRAIPPGEILKDELDFLGYSASHFSKLIKVPTNRITAILNAQRSITADTALRFSEFFGTTPEFWMNLQTSYELKCISAKFGKQIKSEVQHRDAA